MPALASGSDVSVGTVLMDLSRLSGHHGLRPPAEMSMVGKALLNLDEVGRTLDPDFEPNAAIRRHAAELMEEMADEGRTDNHEDLVRIEKAGREDAILSVNRPHFEGLLPLAWSESNIAFEQDRGRAPPAPPWPLWCGGAAPAALNASERRRRKLLMER
mgnify:CR=1 FL=1